MGKTKSMATKTVRDVRSVRIDPTATSSRAAPPKKSRSSRTSSRAQEEAELMPPERVGEITPATFGLKFTKRAHLTKFDILKKRELASPRHIDWELLRRLGLVDDLIRVISPKSLGILVNLRESAYTSLVLEFLSTLEAPILEGANYEEGLCTFRLGGRQREMNLASINRLFGLRSYDHTADRNDRRALWFRDEQWQRITGEDDVPPPGRAKAAHIRHPVIRILQRYFANSITARGAGVDKVPRKELLLLSSILEERDVDFAAVMMSNMAFVSRQTSGKIRVGPLVTKLAQHFDVDFSRAIGEIPPKPMDFTYFRKMKVLFEKNGNYFWVLGNTGKAMRLPDTQRTFIRVGLGYARTWLIEDRESDPTEAEVAGGGRKRKVIQRPQPVPEPMLEEDEEDEEFEAEEEESGDEESEEEEHAEYQGAPADYGGGFQSSQMDQIAHMFSNMTTNMNSRIDHMEQHMSHQMEYMRQSQAHAQCYFDDQIHQMHDRMSGWTSEGFPEHTYAPYQGYMAYQPFPPYAGYPPPPPPPEDQ